MARRRSSGAGVRLPLPALRPVEEADGGLLRRRWRSIMGRHPPKTRSPALMARILTWREQVVEVGDIGPRSRAILAAAIRGADERAEAGGKPEAGPIAKRPPRLEPIRKGTVLVREHAGVLHRITMSADGFEWNGRIFGSLSATARAITGVNWSGRRFFGLDQGLRDMDGRSRQSKPTAISEAARPS
jgi:Protein of unknown function (DUF2924)